MTILSRRAVLSPVLSALFALWLTTGMALAQDVDPEWPCVQRLVPDVSLAVLWPLPVEEGMNLQWKQDPVIRDLAERLGDLLAYTEVQAEAVHAFAQGIPDEQKQKQLSLLAVGILEVTNGIRRQYIRGIKRYTRQQIAIADQIGETLNQISSLEGSQKGASKGTVAQSPDWPASGEPDPQREELMETLAWHERVYDQREQAIRSLCEQPVELEETLSDVLRDLAQYLP